MTLERRRWLTFNAHGPQEAADQSLRVTIEDPLEAQKPWSTLGLEAIYKIADTLLRNRRWLEKKTWVLGLS